jgi:hypothetical protein
LVTEEVDAHETTTFVVKAPSSEVAGSADMALKVKVSCPSACDLWGRMVRIVAHDDALAGEAALVSFDGTENVTDDFVVRAPFEPGEYTWTAVFPAQEKGGVLHEESSTSFSFTVEPHGTSLEVWDVPSPIALGDEFKIKVGVRCSSECSLAGEKIEIYDHEGTELASATLGEEPWSGNVALYWAEVELKAPGTEARQRWTARHPKPDPESLHEETSSAFTFVTAREPECVVTIEVVDKDAETPNANARVRLRPLVYRGSTYMAQTDESGVATLRVPRGKYQLYVWGDEYEKVVPSLKVDGDLTEKVVLSAPLSSWRQLPR